MPIREKLLAYKIKDDSKVFKQLCKIDKKEVKDILDKIESFAEEPILTQIKKLKIPFDRAYRLRAETRGWCSTSKTILCSFQK